MNSTRLTADMKFINQIGRTLSLDERFPFLSSHFSLSSSLKLELALMKINEAGRFDQVLFWGKIEGSGGDYYIALALNFLNFYEFPHKTFYYRYKKPLKFQQFEFSQHQRFQFP